MDSLSSQSSMVSASIRSASPGGRVMATSARGGGLHGAGAEVKNRLENTAGHGAGLVRDGEAMLGTRPRVHIADLLAGAHHAPVAQKPAQDAREGPPAPGPPRPPGPAGSGPGLPPEDHPPPHVAGEIGGSGAERLLR